MTPRLLELICDPIEKTPLELTSVEGRDGDRIITGTLRSSTGRSYPIRNGIPRFVEQNDSMRESVESFGDEWNHFNFMQFKQHWLMHTVKHTFGGVEAFRGKLIVDAGGGSGAQTLWMLEAGAEHVILLDLSDSVDDVVQRNLATSGFRNVDVIQCSIDQPPLRPRSIPGMVICHNVIQHTPSVERTAAALYETVGPGGEFVFNCYHLNDEDPIRWIRHHVVHGTVRKALARTSFGFIHGYARAAGVMRQVPLLGLAFEKLGFYSQGDVPAAPGESFGTRLKRRYRATVLNTFDDFGSHSYQHYKSERDIRTLVASLQPDPAKVFNLDQYFSRPMPIGCAIRIMR